MDSIIGIHYTVELGTYFPDVVSPMDLYRYPTLNQLIDYIIQQVNMNSEQTHITDSDVHDAMSIEQLNREQLEQLIEAELNELELAYD